MRLLSQIVFFFCLAVIVYEVAVYPLLLSLLARWRPRRHLVQDIEPTVTITMAARNEAGKIRSKLDSILALDYPRGKLEVIVGSDGSTDETVKVVEEYPREIFRVLDLPRSGKATVNNHMVAQARGEIVVDTTSSGYFEPDFLRVIVRHFADREVGCVTGEISMQSPDDSGVTQFEGAYFRYEWRLRQLESALGVLCVSNGGVLAFRKDLYDPIGPSSDVDNMVPLMVVGKGYRVLHEPRARTMGEPWIADHAAQLKGRVRQVTRSQQDIFRAAPLLNPLRHPAIAWVLWSHRLLRWWTPFFALLLFVANLFLLDQAFYLLTFLAQLVLYALAVVGRFKPERTAGSRLLSAPATALNVALCFVMGTINAARGKQIVTW